MILEVTKMFPHRPNNKPDLQGCMWLWKIFVRNILEKEEKEIGARFHSISALRLKKHPSDHKYDHGDVMD